jgi:hypothetical protein
MHWRRDVIYTDRGPRRFHHDVVVLIRLEDVAPRVETTQRTVVNVRLPNVDGYISSESGVCTVPFKRIFGGAQCIA